MKFKKIYYTVSVPFFIGAGDAIGYWTYTSKHTGNGNAVFGIIAVAMIFYGFFCLVFLFGLLFPFLSKTKPGSSVAARNALHLLFTILFIVLITSSVLPYFYFTKKYKQDQLKKYGVTQKVLIEDKFSAGRGSKFVSFHIITPDSVYYGELPCENYTAGDSATIIYSSYDPNFVSWKK